MSSISNILKVSLIEHLEKSGQSVEEFEKSLGEIDTGEGVLKVAGVLGDLFHGAVVGPIKDAYIPSSLAMGSLGGIGLGRAEDSVKDQNKEFDEIKQHIAILRRMRDRIRKENAYSN